MDVADNERAETAIDKYCRFFSPVKYDKKP